MAYKRKSNRSGTRKISPNAFMNYLRDFRKEMQGQNISMIRIAQLAGQRWREMTPVQRMPYVELAEKARKAGKILKRKRLRGKGMRYERSHKRRPQDEAADFKDRRSTSSVSRSSESRHSSR